MAVRAGRGARRADRQHPPPDRKAAAVVRDVGRAPRPPASATVHSPCKRPVLGPARLARALRRRGGTDQHLYEVLTGIRQFPEANALERGHPIRPLARIMRGPEHVETRRDVCGRASRTTRCRDRAGRAVARPVARARRVRPRIGCRARSLARGRPAPRDAPARARLPGRSRTPDPPLVAAPPVPGARPASRASLVRDKGIQHGRREYDGHDPFSPRFRHPRTEPSTSARLTDPHVRADAARRDRHLHLDHRHPVRQPRRRLGPDLPLCRLGCRCGHRRRAPVPPCDELERGARPVVGAVRDLEGRPRSLGRDRRRLSRRRSRREARRGRRLAARRLPRPGAARGAGGRADRQLVEPGALREADRACRGASRSTRCTGRSSSIDQATYHPAFLYELLWNLFAAALARLRGRTALPPAAPGALRPLHRALLVRALLDRAHPGRPRESHPRPPRQHLGLGARLRRRPRLVLALAAPPRPRCAAQVGRSAPPPAGPKMAVPKSRVRPGG